MATNCSNEAEQGRSQTPALDAAMANTLPLMQQTSTSRMRRHRERRRKGLRHIAILVREGEISELVRRGLLEAAKRDDPTAIRSAIYCVLERSLSRQV